MRILFIAPYVPSPIRVRSYQIIRHLARLGHRITLVALDDSARDLLRTTAEGELRAICDDVYIVPHPKPRANRNCLAALPTPVPLWAAYCHSSQMARLLYDLCQTERFDVAHIEHLRAAHFGGSLGDLPTVFDSVDCITDLRRQMRATGSIPGRLLAGEEWIKLRTYEPQMCRRFDRIAITTPADNDALTRLAPDLPPITIIRNGVDTNYFAPAAVSGKEHSAASLIFSGKMSYAPNADAARFLAHSVLPQLRRLYPDLKLTIAGSAPSRAVRALGRTAGITVTGQVDDLRPFFAGASLAVCPMQVGVGIQNKALEAMAMALPVVATGLVARSLPGAVEAGALTVAESAEEFVTACSRLLRDQVAMRAAGKAARVYAESYSWADAASGFVRLYNAAIRTKCFTSPGSGEHKPMVQ